MSKLLPVAQHAPPQETPPVPPAQFSARKAVWMGGAIGGGLWLLIVLIIGAALVARLVSGQLFGIGFRELFILGVLAAIAFIVAVAIGSGIGLYVHFITRKDGP